MTTKSFKCLPKRVRPTHYDILLEVNLENLDFTGKEIIDVEIKKKTKRIVLNCLNIDIKEVQFMSIVGSSTALSSNNIVYNTEDETVTLQFPQELPIGEATLNISFVGDLNDKMKGFYRSKYQAASGQEKYCAVTHFEPTGARWAFPCWDEPAIKATFDITIVAPKDKVVLSNMDVNETKDSVTDASLQVVTFNRTPIMSTYLVAFIVGDFDFVEGRTEDDVLVRVYTPVGKKEQGQFALDLAVKCIPFYGNYFGIRYHLPKIDLVAISDFPIGAMENWGLVTYRETALLFDPANSSKFNQRFVALVVAHELAHNWFGNLTTMKWWTDLWLKEGFASWCEYLTVDKCCCDVTNIWSDFAMNESVPALRLDALESSHPIEVLVGHPSQVDEIFDAISYCKGSSIIHMLHAYVGEKAFRCGLHSYLTTFKFKNAETNDLWDHLEKASKKPVKQVMSTWTKQMGFPVLTVTNEQVESQRIIKISQKKFTVGGKKDPLNQLWSIPITIITSKNPTKTEYSTLMSDPEMVIFLDNMKDNDWVKLNPGTMGFYRTCYSTSMTESLIPAIQSLSAVDRLGIENDLFALSVAGVSPTSSFLNVLSGFKDEEDYTVWSDLDVNLSFIEVIMQNTNSHALYKEFARNIYRPAFNRLESNRTVDPLSGMLRGLLLRRLGAMGDEEVIDECKKRFEAHVDGSCLIPADLRSAVYCTAMEFGDACTLDQMMSLYRNASLMEEKSRLLRSMGATNNPELIAKVLNFSLSDEVRFRDTVAMLSGCTRSLTGRRLAWKFVKKNWHVVRERYGGILLSRLIKATTESLTTTSEYHDVKNFFSTHDALCAERAVKQSLESIHANITFLEREEIGITSWLETYMKNLRK